ncbi:AAA family ATPase [Novosphingobium terrae]|uniref:AAA family ATPase n=1 Tax=Novosphingobium terrae TaxID=2726189 RepID=UPI00197DAF93|nr:AAA family ATPase [Novosphingobium terrae]
MRILAIRGSNLASLAGDFEVDFTTEPLSSSGIFAITGPTGAGKSTLLDAVCLALFAEIPRLRAAPTGASVGTQDNGIGAKDARSILRHGAGQGHAEVDFAMPGGGHYRARWDVRRARGKADGTLQSHSHAFERLDTGERMGGTNTETRNIIADVIGLTADQFTRAVLLAQGDFEAFIRADANERAALLERLTGSQIYTLIGQRAWSKANDMKAGLDALRQQIAAQHGLDDEARVLAETALEESAKAHTRALGHKEALEAEQRRQARGRELLAQVEQAQHALSQAQHAHENALPRREALIIDRKASRLLPLQVAQTSAQQDLTSANARLADRREAVETSLQREQSSSTEAQLAATKFAAQEETVRNLAPALDAARALDRQITEALSHLERARQHVSRTQEAASLASEAAALARGRHDTALARQTAAENWLEANAALRGLSDREMELGTLIADYAATQDRYREGEATLAEREDAERKAVVDHMAAGDAFRAAEDAAKTAASLRQQAEIALPPDGALTELSAQLDLIGAAQIGASEATQALREAERGATELETTRTRRSACTMRVGEIDRTLADQAVSLVDLDTRLRQARRVLNQSIAASDKAAEALRSQLVDDEPCPVCGSAEHPLSALETLLGKHLEENRAQSTALEDELTRLRGDNQALLREKESLTQQGSVLETEEKGQVTALSRLTTANQEAQTSLQRATEALGIEPGSDTNESLSTLRQSVRRQRDELLAAQAAADRYRRAEDATRIALEEARLAEQVAGEVLRKQSDAVAAVKTVLAKLEETQSHHAVALESALAPIVDWRSLSDAASWLRSKAQSWRDHAAELADAVQALPALTQTLNEAVSARDVSASQYKAADESAHQRDDEAATLQAQRAGLLDGRAAQDVEREVTQATNAARMASEAARQQREEAAQALAGHRAAMAEADEHLVHARTTLDNTTAALAQALDDGRLTVADLMRVAALAPDALDIEAQTLTSIEGAVREAQAVFDKCRQDLARHQDTSATAEPISEDAFAAALADARNALETASRMVEEARVAIRQDDLVRERTAALRAQLEAASAKAHVWLQLSQLIGDSEGRKFRRFAQGLTLDRLLEQANASLVQLKPRFALERGMGGDMLIQVIDNDMGGRVRGLHNLSGGERFLISLALALGLAAMSTARGVKIESLFIDEGFGALDPSSLGQALALLEHLHASGRRVGVISHVEELKERIAVKIEVRPTGRGTSQIEVIAG